MVVARRQQGEECQKGGREGERDGDFSRAVVLAGWLAHSIGTPYGSPVPPVPPRAKEVPCLPPSALGGWR